MSEWPKPTWVPIALRCGKCGREWDDWQPSHVPVPTWLAHIATYRCPDCGAKKGLLLRASTDTKS